MESVRPLVHRTRPDSDRVGSSYGSSDRIWLRSSWFVLRFIGQDLTQIESVRPSVHRDRTIWFRWSQFVHWLDLTSGMSVPLRWGVHAWSLKINRWFSFLSILVARRPPSLQFSCRIVRIPAVLITGQRIKGAISPITSRAPKITYVLNNPFPFKPQIVLSAQKPFYS